MNRVASVIKLDYARKQGLTGKNVGIAVMDTGISPHPDIVYNDGPFVSFFDTINHQNRLYDDNGHGTHVAGIIAGNGMMSNKLYEGIAPDCKLHIIKILDKNGEGNIKNVMSGINWLLKNKDKYNIRIVNISVGSVSIKKFDENSPLVRSINTLWEAGLIVVTAAGNNGPADYTIGAPGNSRKLEKSMAELQFSIDAEAFKKAVADVFKKEGKKYPVQGFRKGKAPKALIEKMYGADVFTYDAINELFPEAFEAAVKEAGVEPVGRPEVTVDSASEAEGATLTVKVAVKPEVKVGSYNGLTVEKTVHTVTDEAVDAELKRVQERNARELTREGAAQNGDIADIDFEGFVDGVAFEGGKAEHYNLTLGSGSFIPGFEEQVVGHSAGEEFDVNVTFPTEYQAAELAGKAAVFKIKLHEVKYKELPALDDELAKDCSEYDTLDEFKASIRKNNQEQLDKQDDLAVENALVDQVIESMEGEIPQAMYDVRMDEMVNDFAFRVEQQGLRLEDYLKYMGQSMEQFRAAFMPQAEKQVKIGLALEAVAAAEHIEASEDEINAEIKRIADQYKMEEDKVRELINLEDLKQDLARTKAIDFIKSHANIVVKPAEAEKAADAE